MRSAKEGMEWGGGIRRWSGEEGLEDGVGRRD